MVGEVCVDGEKGKASAVDNRQLLAASSRCRGREQRCKCYRGVMGGRVVSTGAGGQEYSGHGGSAQDSPSQVRSTPPVPQLSNARPVAHCPTALTGLQ